MAYKKKKSKRTSKVSLKTYSTKTARRSLYEWAWSLKGKGSLSKIGKKMSAIKRSGGRGSTIAIRNLGKISREKKAFINGAKSKRR